MVPTPIIFGPADLDCRTTCFNRQFGFDRIDADEREQKKMVATKKFGIAALVVSGLAAAVLGFAAPAQAGIDTNPGLPHYIAGNHDDANTTGGFVDQSL